MEQFELNGDTTLRIEGVLSAVNESLQDVWIEVDTCFTGNDVINLTVSDKFWSPLDRGRQVLPWIFCLFVCLIVCLFSHVFFSSSSSSFFFFLSFLARGW